MKPIIIIPALNPNRLLLTLVTQLTERGFTLVVVDDGSDVAYKTIFNSLKNNPLCHVLTHDVNRGKGQALKTAIRFVNDSFPDAPGIITADADGQHSVKDIEVISFVLESNQTSIILGTREFKLGKIPFRSYLGNKITSFVYLLSTGKICHDTQTGLRAIPKLFLGKCLSISGNRYEYEMNMLIEFARLNVTVLYHPISTIYINDNEESHFHPISDSARIYFNIAKYSISSILSAVIDLLAFTLGAKVLFGASVLGIFFSTTIARFISGNFNFFMNKHWVFESKHNLKEESRGYIVLFLSQMLLSWFFVNLFKSITSDITVVKMVVDTLLFCISYIVQRKFIFNKKHVEKLL